jgi:hypothetical protein
MKLQRKKGFGHMGLDIGALSYDGRERKVFYQGVKLNSQFSEPTLIGFCEGCEGCVNSEMCCGCEGHYVVAGVCEGCGRVVLIVFDADWEVVGECVAMEGGAGGVPITGVSDFKSIPDKYLEAVFTPAEIESMTNKYNNKNYSRQNLYRARKKYKKFKSLFNIDINI